MSIKENKKLKFDARAVALVGIMTATMTCGKMALAFLPNIEVVTLLSALYGYVFGIYGVVATLLFVCIEPMIYGIGSWIITYFIYWPSVALVFMLLSKKGGGGRWLLTGVASLMTLCFGVLSSLVDCAFYFGIGENYLLNLPLYYLRGIVFYLVQLATNFALFSTLFIFLSGKLNRIKNIKFSD